MITDMFDVIGEAIVAFVQALGQALSGITALFYTPASTSDGTGTFTVLGVLLLIAVGVGIVYWSFRLIRNLISQRRA